MRKLLGIIGSPRKNGNTHVLVSRVLDGARDAGASAEAILLGELNIEECDGCHACWKKNHVCSKHDDMTTLYRKIVECDSLVFGTPVYWYGPTAIMKCFIDRFVYFNCSANRSKIRDKTSAIVVPFEDTTLETASPVVDFFDKSLNYLEMTFAEAILVPGVTKRGEVRSQKQVMDRCYALGKRLAIPQDDSRTA